MIFYYHRLYYLPVTLPLPPSLCSYTAEFDMAWLRSYEHIADFDNISVCRNKS